VCKLPRGSGAEPWLQTHYDTFTAVKTKTHLEAKIPSFLGLNPLTDLNMVVPPMLTLVKWGTVSFIPNMDEPSRTQCHDCPGF